LFGLPTLATVAPPVHGLIGWELYMMMSKSNLEMRHIYGYISTFTYKYCFH